MNRLVLVLCLTLTACSVSSSVEPAAASANVAPATSRNARLPAAARPGDAPALGFRPGYSECIDRADAAIPATQACIDAEGAYQRARLEHELDAAKKRRPDRVGAIQFQQTAWQSDVEAKCRWNAETEGQQQRIEANLCLVDAIAARADELSR